MASNNTDSTKYKREEARMRQKRWQKTLQTKRFQRNALKELDFLQDSYVEEEEKLQLIQVPVIVKKCNDFDMKGFSESGNKDFQTLSYPYIKGGGHTWEKTKRRARKRILRSTCSMRW